MLLRERWSSKTAELRSNPDALTQTAPSARREGLPCVSGRLSVEIATMDRATEGESADGCAESYASGPDRTDSREHKCCHRWNEHGDSHKVKAPSGLTLAGHGCDEASTSSVERGYRACGSDERSRTCRSKPGGTGGVGAIQPLVGSLYSPPPTRRCVDVPLTLLRSFGLIEPFLAPKLRCGTCSRRLRSARAR